MSGARASAKQAAQILALVNDTDWNRDEVQRRIIGRWGLLRDIAVALDDPQLSEEQVRAMHPLFYNKKATFQSLLAACRQDWVSSDFNETNFPLEPVSPDEDEWEVVEYHFGRLVTGEEAFSELEKMGYRLCGPRRAMEFVAVHPDIQGDHPLVVTARWQSSSGYWCAPVFYLDVVKRKAYLEYLGHVLNPSHGWLVLHKRAA
jgi:hypothetical protein